MDDVGQGWRKADWAWAIAIVVLAGLGTFAALGGWGPDPRAADWPREHLDVIKAQLDDLKVHLLDFHKPHGRYPTNNEGLAALDNFESRVTVPAAWLWERVGNGTYWLSGGWNWHQDTIKRFRNSHGRAPATLDEVEDAWGRRWMEGPSSTSPAVQAERREREVPGQVEVAFTRNNSMFLLSPAGVLSPWRLPYVYENRRGLPASAFADSPVARDRKGRFSVRVDDGVFVSCVGGELYGLELAQTEWQIAWPRYIGYGVLALAGLLLIVRLVLGKRRPALVLVLGLSAGAGAAVAVGERMTCYDRSPIFSDRPAAMVIRQRELLDKYRSAGVISQATYDAAIAAANGPPTTQPATAASRPRPAE